MRPRVIVDIMWSSQRHFSIGRYDHWLVCTDTIGNSSNVWVFHSLPKTCPAGPMGVPYTFCWRRRRWRASMFLMRLLGMRRVTPSFQIFLWEEAVLEKPGAMLRMTATLWAGMPLPRTSRWALQYLDPVSRAFHGVSFWPWNWKYKAGLFLKFPGLFLKFPGLFLKFPGLILKCPGIKGWPQHRREKGIELELWVGSICLPLARGVGAPRCLVSMFWNWPRDKPQLLSCSGCVRVEQDMFLRLHHEKK